MSKGNGSSRRTCHTNFCKNLDLELVEIEYVKEGKNWFLRVYIDKDNRR